MRFNQADWTEWQAFAASISVIVLGITMFIFWLQFRAMRGQVRHLDKQVENSRRATESNVYQGISELMIDIDRIYIEHPSLRPYFYDNWPEPTETAMRFRVSALAEVYIDLMDDMVTQEPHLSDFIKDGWERYFIDIMRTSPALQNFWRENRTWYNAQLQNLLDGVVDTFGSDGPKIPT
jgi:hypothetical protein